jgi:hypothetical protein
MKRLLQSLFTVVLAGSGHAAIIVGNDLSDRGTTDSYSGQIFLLNANLASVVGQRVESWSFFNNQLPGVSVTPVLVEDTSGTLASFTMRGIGASVVAAGGGVQSSPFNLASGTDVIGTNYYLGYYDGAWDPGSASATPNPGGLEWNNTDDPPVAGQIDSVGSLWLHGIPNGADNPANMGVGAVNPHDVSFGGVVDTRHHSVQFVIVPEPSAALLGGLAGFALLRRRRA